MTHLELLPSPLSPPSTTTPASPHTHNFGPTLAAGFISGSLFSYFQRPTPRSIARHLKGGLTLGLGCVLVQSLVNEGDLVRIKLLQRSEEKRRRRSEDDDDSSTRSVLPTAIQSDSPPLPSNRPSILSPLPASAPSNAQHFSDPTSLTFSERSDLLIANAWRKTRETVRDWAPLKKIDEREFADKVERERDAKRQELEQVRTELAQLHREVKSRE